jgi:hypothetical protein
VAIDSEISPAAGRGQASRQTSPTRFVVAGCSRSGTTYMAKLMTALGFPCSHERIFNICRIYESKWDLSDPMTAFSEPEAAQGDASFLSIPYLDQLPKGTVILHQVRDPLKVIRSHMGMRFFAEPYVPSIYLAEEHLDFLDFLKRHAPEIFEVENEIGRCMRYWYHWNRLAERVEDYPDYTYIRYRVEDLNQDTLHSILRKADLDADEQRCEQALAEVSTTTNTRPRDLSWTWANLPAGLEREQVAELAAIYGYSPRG